MTFKFSTRLLAIVGFCILIITIVAVNRIDDWATTVSYPLDTWRMDLDDFFVAVMSVGILLGGIGGFSVLWRKADKAHAHADKAIGSINGGMTSLATQAIQDELRVADIEIGLGARVKALEESKEDCMEREKRCLEQNEKLRNWVIDRLDETPRGRNGDRHGE